MSFPYRHLFEVKKPETILSHIAHESDLNNQRLLQEVRTKRIFPDQLISLYSIYQEGAYLADLFTEEARVRTKVWDGKKRQYHSSPYEYWEKHQAQLKGQSLEQQRDSIYLNSQEATQFNIFAATRIYNLVAKLLKREITIFDPFAGWGDRALAALAAQQVKSYTGVDCNPLLVPGYAKLQTLNREKLTFLQASIEEIKLDQQFDLIFTSPPFYNFEEYETISGKQSTSLYPQYKDWLVFFRKLLTQCKSFLKKDGFLMFHIGDTSAAPTLCQDLQRVFREESWKFVQRIDLITKTAKGQLKRPVPIWVYKI